MLSKVESASRGADCGQGWAKAVTAGAAPPSLSLLPGALPAAPPFPAGFRAEKPGTAEIKSLAAAWTHLLRSAAKQLGAASLPGLLGGTRGALEQEAPEAGRWAEGLAGT